MTRPRPLAAALARLLLLDRLDPLLAPDLDRGGLEPEHDAAMARARVFVDARATTIHHIGEIMAPIASGAIAEADILADFYDLDSGRFQRGSDDEITVAKNGGGAHLDLMTARYILDAVGS